MDCQPTHKGGPTPRILTPLGTGRDQRVATTCTNYRSGGRDLMSQGLRELLAWLEAAPPGTLLDAKALANEVAEVVGRPELVSTPEHDAPAPPWSALLWTAPSETRLNVRELAEAVGRPRSWVYRHTAPKGDLAPIPHRRLDGLLVFVAGEVREWLGANEEVAVPSNFACRSRAA